MQRLSSSPRKKQVAAARRSSRSARQPPTVVQLPSIGSPAVAVGAAGVAAASSLLTLDDCFERALVSNRKLAAKVKEQKTLIQLLLKQQNSREPDTNLVEEINALKTHVTALNAKVAALEAALDVKLEAKLEPPEPGRCTFPIPFPLARAFSFSFKHKNKH